MIKYLYHLNHIVAFCEEFKEDVIKTQFKDKKGNRKESPYSRFYCYFPRYVNYWQVLDNLALVIDMFGIDYLDDNADYLKYEAQLLNKPNSVEFDSDFIDNIDNLIGFFKIAENELKRKISLLDKTERKRLDEAINCYVQRCNYSTVAMAVSTIESRLYSLMKNKCPDAELDNFTLGQLIREYLDNEERYEKCIPKKHKHLLEHCNIYRIFSVHPKKEKITRAVTTSILSMTLDFLFDDKINSKS